MNIKNQDNKLYIGEKCFCFDHNIKKCIEFPSVIVLMFSEMNRVQKNNIIAIDYNARELWNISDIIQLNYAEAYVALSKETDNTISVISYNGVKFYIDIIGKKVVKKLITK